MSENNISNQSADDEIDLRELFRAIWRGKLVIIATTILFGVIAVFYALSLPNIYKSDVLLAPALEQKNAGLSGQLGGLASLAGINIGGGSGVDKTTLALEIIKSREFIGRFIEKNNLRVPLLAVKSWDRNDDKIVIDDELYDIEKSMWIREGAGSKSPEPSLHEAYKEFIRIMRVNRDETTGMVRLSIEHISPTLAKEWVERIVQEINAEMKARDIEEATASISYLQSQIQMTNISEVRSSLFLLIEEQTKTLMLANVRNDYAFKVVDMPIVPEEKAKPNRSMMVILGIMLGFMSSVLLVTIKNQMLRN